MQRRTFALLTAAAGLLPACGQVGGNAAAARPGQRDLATEVKAVFQAKCSECHGPRVPKPKGNFGYVLDLKRLASDPKKVVPSKPEESVLWQLVRDEMMPAEGARAGPLTKEQKETIRAWIEAGAPSTPIESSAPSPGNTAAERPPAPAAKRPSSRRRAMIGRSDEVVIVSSP